MASAQGRPLSADLQEGGRHAILTQYPEEARDRVCPRYPAPHERVVHDMAPKLAERPAISQPLLSKERGGIGCAAPQLASLPQRERERMLSWYTKRDEDGTRLAAETELGGAQGTTLGCVGSREGSKRKVSLSSPEA